MDCDKNSENNMIRMRSHQSDIANVCHACLCTSTTMYLMPDYPHFLGESNNVLPSYLCRMCTALYNKCVQFQSCAKVARNWLVDVWTNGQLSEDNLIKKHLSLCIPFKLAETHHPPNFYNYTFDTDNEVKIESPSPLICDNIQGEALFFPSDDNNDFDDEDFDIPLKKFKEKQTILTEKDKTEVNHKPEQTLEVGEKQNVECNELAENKTKKRKNISEKRKVKKQKLSKKKTQVKFKRKKEASENQDLSEEDKVLHPRKYVRKAAILNGEEKLMEEFFDIKILSIQEQKEEFAKRKESINYNKSRLRCEFCFKGFMHQRAFEIHMGKHSQKMGEKTCKICHRHCASERVLRKHMDHHKFRFTCRKCNYQTKAKSSAKLHIDWHNGKQYNCEKCGQVFMRISTLLSHVRIKHPTDHVCGLCGYSFLGEKGIYFHRQLKHKFEDNLTIPSDGPLCTECNIRFANQDALTTHLRVSPKHGECKRNDAPPVPRRAPLSPPGGRGETRGRRPLQHREPKNRRDHTMKTLDPPVPCEQCGEPMHSGMQYRLHFHKAHPASSRTLFPLGAKPTLCHVCGKMFKTTAILQDHMVEHTETPELFKCETCNKGFRKKSSLALHKNIHLGKRYPCPLCGKMFNQVCNRDRHYTYVHSNIKDVKCDYCDKYFKSDEEKKLHTTYVHFKKPYPKRSRKRQMDMSGVKKKRDGYMPEIVEHNWLRDSESSEGSIPH